MIRRKRISRTVLLWLNHYLYQLSEHNKAFKWTDQCQDSFVMLPSALVSSPVLAFPDCS